MLKDVDQFGNNSVHLAASGGNLLVFQTLLFWGVSVDRPNTRGHTAKDLATNVFIIQLIKLLEAAGPTHKYFCMTCRRFLKPEDYRMEWVYENADSTEMEKPEGRCQNCWNVIRHHTEELLAIIDKQDHKLLTDKLTEIEKGILIKNESGKEEL
jgi:DNA-directed RNA polymerase subunit RPC12/RpoP